jgi:hypothetical protein
MTRSDTTPHDGPSDRTDGATNADTSVDALIGTLRSDLAAAFTMIDWAEDEIARATYRHPDHADVLYHAFVLLRPRDLGPGMTSELVYRSHAAELLERVATGIDTRPATAAEMCLVCAHVSQRAPIHGAAAGLYFRMWQLAFPHSPITVDQAEQQVHYERLYGPQIDDLENELRGKTADPRRRLSDVRCAGMHHGKRVVCRYTAASTPVAARVATTRQRRVTR